VDKTISPVCSGGASEITIANSEVGVIYQLRNNTDDSPVGSPVSGTGSTINLSTGTLVVTTSYNVLATRGNCAVELSNTVTVNVAGLINSGVAVTAQSNPICEGNPAQINISNSEVGVSYQLRNDTDDSSIGVAVAGTGGTIVLPTNVLNTSTAFNVLASNGACSIELTNRVTVNVDINPDPTLVVSAEISPLCVGGSTKIIILSSEIGVLYQLRNDSDDSLIGSPVTGTGGAIELPTGVLSSTTIFNVFATAGVCVPIELSSTVTVTVAGTIDLTLIPNPKESPICSGTSTSIQIANSEVGVNYQLINDSDNSLVPGVIAGTGGLIELLTGNLTITTSFRVLVTSTSCSAELTAQATVTVTPLPLTSLAVTSANSAVCESTSTVIQVLNSQAGVTYQLRNDADDSIVSGAVIGNGSTIDLPTGILTTNKTFNVLATNVTCSLQLTSTITITINPAPLSSLSLVAQDPTICSGKSTFIQVLNSEPGIVYQLRNDANNSIISGATFGNGGTISLPTGPILADITYNVTASNSSNLCSVQLLSKASVTLKSINDPSCSNCSTVVVSTVNPVKVTCGATSPDGGITFQIDPAVPVVNIIGVKIQINGPTPKTQTDNFVFTGLAAGDYTYVVTYGDENNPDCLKTGTFVIELSREPDPITFDVVVNDYDCLTNKGSVSLENRSGASNTDFEYIVLDNNKTILYQGTILNATAGSFPISDLLIGDYQVQLSQNQQVANGCVGIVTSSFIDFSIAEPEGGCPVIIPNIFTPNGDGVNDLFEIRNLPAGSQLSITNRWGKEIFSSSDYKNDWTGDNISDGIYFYRLVAEGEAITGWVEILR